MPLPERSTVSVPALLFQGNSAWSRLSGAGCSRARKAQAAACVCTWAQASARLRLCRVECKFWLRGRIGIFLTGLFPTACVPLLLCSHLATWVGRTLKLPTRWISGSWSFMLIQRLRGHAQPLEPPLPRLWEQGVCSVWVCMAVEVVRAT